MSDKKAAELNHEFLQIVGGAHGVWVDRDFDLETHNEIYRKLAPYYDTVPEAREALDWSTMGHAVPERIIRRLEERKLWITERS